MNTERIVTYFILLEQQTKPSLEKAKRQVSPPTVEKLRQVDFKSNCLCKWLMDDKMFKRNRRNWSTLRSVVLEE